MSQIVPIVRTTDAGFGRAFARIRAVRAADVSRAEAVNDYWKGQNDRFAKLVNQSVLDRQTQDETHSQFRAAAASLTEVQAKIITATTMLQEKKALRDKAEIDIRVAEADLKRQSDLVRYGTFLAPYDGVVTRRTINAVALDRQYAPI